jgi:hypothetical protein
MEENLLTSEQGIRLYEEAGLSEGTFFRHVREKKIRKVLPDDRQRGAMYNADDIRANTQQHQQRKGGRKGDVESLQIDWSGALDAAAGLRLSQQLYGPDVDIGELAVYQSWRKNNNQLTLCVFSEDRKDCFAELQVLPLAESLIVDILSGKRNESSILADEIRNYKDTGPYHLLVTNAVTLPGRPELLLRLLLRYMDFWVEQYPDRYIQRVYTQAVSERGFMLVQHFFMTPRFDLNFNAYMVDLAYPSASKIVQRFKRQLEEKSPLPEALQWPPTIDNTKGNVATV